MLELLLLIFGIKAVITGVFNVGTGEATGLGARIAGLIWVLPLPLVFVIMAEGFEGGDAFSYYWDNGIYWVELGLIVGCGLVGYIVASVSAHSRYYSREGMRYRTEARGDIYLAKTGERPLPNLKKRTRRPPPRPRRQEEIEEPEVLEEVQELEEFVEVTPLPRRRRRPVRRKDEDEFDDDYEDDEDFRPRKRSRRTLFIILAIGISLIVTVGGLALCLVLRSSDLREYEFGGSDRKFRVQLPEGASEDAKQVAGRFSRVVEVKQKNGLHYLVKELEVRGVSGLEARQSWLDDLRRAYDKEGLKVSKESSTLWDSNNPGRLLAGEVNGSSTRFRARAWLVDDRFFWLIVRGPKGRIKSADVTRFLDSLELPHHPQSR